jgi:hypothetical protein
MPARRRAIELGEARGRAAVNTVGRELELGARSHGLSYAAIGRDVGLSGSQVGRVARGLAPDLTIVQASELLAAVGQELSVRCFPIGRPLRDSAHLALLDRLRRALHASLAWRTEVPLPGTRDLRAWDAMVFGSEWRLGVEAETRVHDAQELQRRVALKQRDGDVEHVILLLAATRHNRAVVRSVGAGFIDAFNMPGRRMLELLRAGVEPGASAIVLL